MLKAVESMLEVVKSSLRMLNEQGFVLSAEGKTWCCDA